MKSLQPTLIALIFAIVFSAGAFAQGFDNLELEGRWAYGPVRAVTGNVNYLYLGNGGYFEILERTTLNQEGKWALPKPAKAIFVSGSYAYVADADSGLRIINISDENNPTEVGSYLEGATGAAWDVVVNGNYAYVAFGDSGLVIVNVTDKANPFRESSYPTGSVACGIAYNSNHVYVTYKDGNVRSFNVANPASISMRDVYTTPGSAEDIVISGNYAYVADGTHGLYVINIADPTDLTLQGKQNTSGTAYAVAFNNNMAYMADDANGLVAIQVNLIPFFLTPKDSVDTDGNAMDVWVYNDGIGNITAFVGDTYRGLREIDASNPAALAETGSYDIGGHTVDVDVLGNYAYIADSEKGFRVVNITNKQNPVKSGNNFTEQLDGTEYGVDVSGTHAYVAAGTKGLHVVDISDPTNPDLDGSYDTGDVARAVVVSGNYAYVADGDDGLAVINVTNPTTPTLVKYVNTAGLAYDVAVLGNYAYVADDNDGVTDGGLRIIDITNPLNPTMVGSWPYTGGDLYAVAVSNNYAYLAAGNQGLYVIDVSTPGGPSQHGHYDTPGRAVDVDVSGDFAYVADGSGGVVLLDVSIPSNIKLSGYYHTGDVAQGICVTGFYAYVADGDDGLYILDNILDHLNHFVPTAATGKSDIIIVDNATINGFRIETGDEIGIFYTTNCVGGGTYRGTFGTTPLIFPAWLEIPDPNNPSGAPLVFGARIPDRMIFKIWDKSANVERGAYPRGISIGDSSFGGDMFTQFDHLEAPALLHFSPVDPTGNLQLVIVENATIDGEAFAQNDEIGVFDGATCVGAVQYQAATFPDTIPVWLTQTFSDPASTVLNGATVGNTLDFKIWDASEAKETIHVDTTYTTHSDNNGEFGDPVTTVELEGFTERQNIACAPAKLNMISFNRWPPTPANRDISVMVDDVNNLVLVQDDQANVYIPPSPPGPNTIGEVNFRDGYQLYHCNGASQTAQVEGYTIQPDTMSQELDDGQLYMIAYPYQDAYSVTQVFQSIQSSVEIIQDDNGQFWIPQFNVNTIGDMQPGKGYQIFVDEELTYDYPDPAGLTKPSPIAQRDAQTKETEAPSHFVFYETGKAYAVVVTGSQAFLKTGDEIGVFDGELCVGAVVYDGEFPLAIAAWEAIDLEGLQAPGFRAGQPLSIRVWNSADGNEYAAPIVCQNQTNALFASGAMAVLEIGHVEGLNALPETFALGKNYPNPFNPVTMIPYQLPEESHVHLVIYNARGQLIRTLIDGMKQAGRYTVKWNGRDDNGTRVSSGVYFVRMQAGSFKQNQKMVFIQ